MRKARCPAFLSFAATIALLLCPLFATSDDGPPERSITVKVHTNHARTLLLYNEPPGSRSDRLLSLYDSNGSGQIEDSEAILARSPMLRRARQGLDLSFTGAMSAFKDPQVRFKRMDDGGISMQTYQRVDFVTKTNEFSIDVTLSNRKGVPPLDVVVEPVEDWKFKDGAANKTAKLVPGKTERFRLQRVVHEQPEPRSSGEWVPPIHAGP